ncbi:MAG: hypothetical protein JWM64_926 [Frankiales bacterium]|nr:hypothetical protein [Frankiales bacterium]
MGIGVSIFLLALGAILAFAVDYTASGIDINVIGVILMVCGALGLLLTMLVLNRATTGRTGVVTEERVVRDRDVY